MEITYIPGNYGEVLDNTDTNGLLSWMCVDPWGKLLTIDQKPPKEKRRELATFMFQLFNGVIMNERYFSDRFINRVDPRFHIVGDGQKFKLSADAIELLGLPGLDRQAEIAELKSLFGKMHECFDRYYEHDQDTREQLLVKIMTGHPGIYVHSKNLGNKEIEKQIEDELNAIVSASPTLQHWVKSTKRMLRTMGPWSWATFTDRDFYEEDESPIFKRSMLNRQKRRMPA